VIGVLVSGRGTNLQALLDAGLPVACVASNRAGAAALGRAEAAGIACEVFELDDHADRPARDEAMADWLEEHDVDLVVLAGYMHLLTPTFLDRFPERIVNVHPSLLPAFPGAHAVEDQLAAGATESGATVHLVTEEVDAGKPSPSVYLEAVRRLDVARAQTAAVEDSSNGLRSAHAAGLVVVALPHEAFPPAPDALALAAARVRSLAELTPELFQRLG